MTTFDLFLTLFAFAVCLFAAYTLGATRTRK